MRIDPQPPPNPTDQRAWAPWQRLILGVLLFYSLFHLGVSVMRYNPVRYPVASGDVRMIYERVSAWGRTGDFGQTGWKEGYVYYPSFYYLLFLPLTQLPFRAVSSLLYGLQFLLFPLAIYGMAKASSDRSTPSSREVLVAFILTVNFQPFLETLSKYKVEGMELFLICLSVLAFRRRKDFWAGALLALATNLKFLPGILVGLFILKREYRVLLGALAAEAAILLVIVFALGWDTFWSYTVLFPFRVLFDQTNCWNWRVTRLEWQSLGAMIDRWFAAPALPDSFLRSHLAGWGTISRPVLSAGIANLLKGILGAVYLWVIRRRWTMPQREPKWDCYLLEISLSMVMIVILGHTIAVHYGILLLPAFVFTGLLLLRRWGAFRLKEKALFVVGYCLSAMAIPGGLLRKLPPHPLWGQDHHLIYLWLSFPTYGYMLLFMCILLCHRRLLEAEAVPR